MAHTPDLTIALERVVPWKELYALIDPSYPKAGKDRPPVGLERMLRIHFLQSWFNLSEDRCRRSPLRHGIHEALRRDRPRERTCPRRDHHLQIPPSPLPPMSTTQRWWKTSFTGKKAPSSATRPTWARRTISRKKHPAHLI